MLKENKRRRVSTGGGIQVCLLLNSDSWDGGCFKIQTFLYILLFSPLPRERIHIWISIFLKWIGSTNN